MESDKGPGLGVGLTIMGLGLGALAILGLSQLSPWHQTAAIAGAVLIFGGVAITAISLTPLRNWCIPLFGAKPHLTVADAPKIVDTREGFTDRFTPAVVVQSLVDTRAMTAQLTAYVLRGAIHSVRKPCALMWGDGTIEKDMAVGREEELVLGKWLHISDKDGEGWYLGIECGGGALAENPRGVTTPPNSSGHVHDWVCVLIRFSASGSDVSQGVWYEAAIQWGGDYAPVATWQDKMSEPFWHVLRLALAQRRVGRSFGVWKWPDSLYGKPCRRPQTSTDSTTHLALLGPSCFGLPCSLASWCLVTRARRGPQ